jgi:aminoglycoside 2'-N-acetyltransferase I
MAHPHLRRLTTDQLSSHEVASIRALLWAAFDRIAADDGDDGGFTELDWEHALGGVHVVASLGERVVAHASVVPRQLQVGGAALATGYVEAVAVDPDEQGRGHGTTVMRDVGAIVTDGYELGALGTGANAFYERLGWFTWQGPSYVRAADGDLRTPDDDGSIMVLRTPSTPALDIHAPISCDWRPGDVW